MTPNDPVLLPLLEAVDPASRRHALELILVRHVQPVVEAVVARYRVGAIRQEDADDLLADINLRVVRRLQERPEGVAPIERLADYVAAVAYNAVYAFLRRRYPARTRLKNRMRYLVLHDRRFAMWERDGEMVCGLAAWQGREALFPMALQGTPSRAMLDGGAPVEALQAIFEMSGGPLRFDDVVRFAAELWQIVDRSAGSDAVEAQRSDARSPAAELETREYVTALWREVQQLRPQQRAALLMNLRDVKGANGLALLLLSGVASFDDIAGTMGLTSERLSEIWNDLPFDDLTIAAMLGISRQQVINLRKAARERLARRTAAFSKTGKP